MSDLKIEYIENEEVTVDDVYKACDNYKVVFVVGIDGKGEISCSFSDMQVDEWENILNFLERKFFIGAYMNVDKRRKRR